MPRRKKVDRPTLHMKDRALQVLDKALKNENAAEYIRVKAAIAMLANDKDEDKPSEDESTRPLVIIKLPDNGRGGMKLPHVSAGVVYCEPGLTEEEMDRLKAQAVSLLGSNKGKRAVPLLEYSPADDD
jgi:hypothetical protein